MTMISIIIPAYNEEKVISKTLNPLLEGIKEKEIELIVVCNGCSDTTELIVKSYGNLIKCLTTSIASKTNALNIGDSEAKGYPRIYLDADTVISMNTVRKLGQILSSGQYCFAVPKLKMRFNNASLLVKSYYDIWTMLPYVKEGMIGTGVYALSEKGRKRFNKFPNVIADDGYVRALFRREEKTTLERCYSYVRSPQNLAGLIKIKTRSRLGTYELNKKFPELNKNMKNNHKQVFFYMIRKTRIWPKIFIYICIIFMTRIMAKIYEKKYGFAGWTRDTTSRHTTIIDKKNNG